MPTQEHIVMMLPGFADKFKSEPQAAEFQTIKKLLHEGGARLEAGGLSHVFRLVGAGDFILKQEKAEAVLAKLRHEAQPIVTQAYSRRL